MTAKNKLISNYTTSVTLNGSAVPVESWRVSFSSDDDTQGRWELKFPNPLYIDIENDEFSLSRGFGGASQTLFDSLKPTTISGTDSAEGWTRGVSGSLQSGSLNYKASPSKILYYYNPNFLDKDIPGGWKLKNGALYYRQGYGTLVSRVFGSYYPNYNLQEGEFECLTNCFSHAQVAIDLATRAGCYFETNCPAVEIQRLIRIEPSQTYFQAISNLFSLWNAEIVVEHDDAGGTTIRALDVHGPGSNESQETQMINLPEALINSISLSQRDESTEVVNHVHIKGTKSITTAYKSDGTFGDGTSLERQQLDADNLQENRNVVVKMDFEPLQQKKEMGEFDEDIGFPDDKKSVKMAKYTQITRYYHEPEDNPSKWILLRELTQVYDADGMIAKVESKHEYTAAEEGFRIVGTKEKTHIKHNVPGKPSDYFEFGLVQNRIIDQSNVVTGCNCVEASELIEGKVLFEFGTDSNGKRYYFNPQTLIQAIQSNNIQTTAGAKQEIKESTISQRQVRIERETPGVLRQITTDYQKLTKGLDVYSQTIRDPDPDNGYGKSSVEGQYEKSFRDGAAPYNPALMIEHPDIADDALANQIAQRAFARRGEPQYELTVELTCLLPMASPGVSVQLPNSTVKEYLGSGSFGDRTITRGLYLIIGSEESASISGDAVDIKQTLRLRSVL